MVTVAGGAPTVNHLGIFGPAPFSDQAPRLAPGERHRTKGDGLEARWFGDVVVVEGR